MTLPVTGPISASQINSELTRTSTNALSLNDADVRTLTGKLTSQSEISYSDALGKSWTKTITVPTGTYYDMNLRTYALNNGWDGTQKLEVALNGTILSTSTGSAALTISGSFPNGVSVVNNGSIAGKGGAGGNGSLSPYGPAYNGGNGGLALSVSVDVSLSNYGIIGGGGGGGGGGGSGGISCARTTQPVCGGGGGGGGGYGSGGGGGYNIYYPGNQPGSAGASGTLTAGGAGGGGGVFGLYQCIIYLYGGTGGAGGSLGSNGNGGGSCYGSGGGQSVGPGGGGTAGAAITGNSYIVWGNLGTVYGARNS